MCALMMHLTVCTASLVTAWDIIGCIEWIRYFRQWYGHVVSSSRRTASLVSMGSFKEVEFVSPISKYFKFLHWFINFFLIAFVIFFHFIEHYKICSDGLFFFLPLKVNTKLASKHARVCVLRDSSIFCVKVNSVY